jgi:hypothetical protein
VSFRHRHHSTFGTDRCKASGRWHGWVCTPHIALRTSHSGTSSLLVKPIEVRAKQIVLPHFWPCEAGSGEEGLGEFFGEAGGGFEAFGDAAAHGRDGVEFEEHDGGVVVEVALGVRADASEQGGGELAGVLGVELRDDVEQAGGAEEVLGVASG